MPENRQFSVAVIPAFNEEAGVAAVVSVARNHVDAVLVVDDGSKDRTAEMAKGAGAQVLYLPDNMGVGFAVKKGLQHAFFVMQGDCAVLVDADGQHPPELIPELLSKLDEGYEVVLAAREFGREMPFIKRVGNKGLTLATRLLAGVSARDSQCGFRALTAEAFKKMRLESNGYGFCSEIIFEVGKNNITYCEVAIPTIYKAGRGARGAGVLDGAKVFVEMLWMKLRRL